jgi:hypothetical protein
VRGGPATLPTMYRDIVIKSKADILKLLQEPTGYAVPRVAAILGMSQQSVHKAVERGSLTGVRYYLAGRKLPVSIEIDRQSVIAYANARQGRDRVAYGYRFDQDGLPI